MKLYSVWYNSYGEDKNFGEVEGGGFNSEVLKKLKEGNSWMSDDSREYWVDGEGEGWKMYCYDGVGVMEVEEGYSVDGCKEEYDKMFNEREY